VEDCLERRREKGVRGSLLQGGNPLFLEFLPHAKGGFIAVGGGGLRKGKVGRGKEGGYNFKLLLPWGGIYAPRWGGEYVHSFQRGRGGYEVDYLLTGRR